MASDATSILLVSGDGPGLALTIDALRRLRRGTERIHVARDGEEALDFLFARRHCTRPERPQVVLLDMKLPKVSGRDVLWVLKTDERTQSIPVVALTGSAEEMDLIEKSGLIADGYVEKPVTREALDRALRHLDLFRRGAKSSSEESCASR